MMQYIDKAALVAEIECRKQDAINNCGGFKSIREHECDSCIVGQYEEMEEILNTLEVKEVNEVPATVMVNKYGNRFISSWPGLKEYNDFKEGQEIKIVIPKK